MNLEKSRFVIKPMLHIQRENFTRLIIILELGISQITFSTVMLYFTWITTTSGFQTQIILFHCNKRSRSRLKWRQEQELKKFFSDTALHTIATTTNILQRYPHFPWTLRLQRSQLDWKYILQKIYYYKSK